jgi:hypothetical protein
MPMPLLAPPLFDVTVRVGCSLVYEVTGTASQLLNIRPQPDRRHAVQFEALSLGDDLRADETSGLDAVDGAFSTLYGGATLSYSQACACQVARGTVGVGDPFEFSRRLDNRWTVQIETPYPPQAE